MVKLHHQTALRNDDPGKVQLIHIFQTLFTSSSKLFQNQQSSLPLTSCAEVQRIIFISHIRLSSGSKIYSVACFEKTQRLANIEIL